jgi:hypothetical protein
VTSSISPQEAAKRNQLHQKHQIAQEIAATEEAIRHLEFSLGALKAAMDVMEGRPAKGHLRFTIETLWTEMNRHKRKLEALRGRGGA